MASDCGSPELGRADRVSVSWDIFEVDNTATVSILIDGTTTWRPTTFDGRTATVLFAGPEFSSPGSSTVVITKTVSCKVRVTFGSIVQTFDGGFVRLLP